MSIDTSDCWELADAIMGSLINGTFNNAYFYGPPGIGKTYAAYEGWPVEKLFSVTFTPETPAAELRGHFMPTGEGKWEWFHGVISQAMRTPGGRLVLNEMQHVGPDAAALLFPVLEGHGTARFTLPTGETIYAAEGFHVVATDNCPPEDLPEEALRDRFVARCHINTYSPGGIDSLSEKTRSWAKKTELSHQDGRWVSLRAWGAIDAALNDGWELHDACIAVFGKDVGETMYSSLKAADIKFG